MTNKKQVVFTNEIIYERNISDRVWPNFLQAQLDDKIKDAWLATKCYYLFTQQWFPHKSKEIIKKLRQIRVEIGRPATRGQEREAAAIRAKAWVDIEEIWCDISNQLESYGIFKRNFTTNNNELALPGRKQ